MSERPIKNKIENDVKQASKKLKEKQKEFSRFCNSISSRNGNGHHINGSCGEDNGKDLNYGNESILLLPLAKD
jgi:hypothetical protein